jgi:hypothetical protein
LGLHREILTTTTTKLREEGREGRKKGRKELTEGRKESREERKKKKANA